MRLIRVLGKVLISVGFGVLLFVGWTLWGTGLYTSQQQDLLEDGFVSEPPVAVKEDETGRAKVPESFAPDAGDAAFRLRIPRIDLKTMVVEGVDTEDLRKGPGHYPECRRGFERPFCTEFEEMWPGENGRVIVSGHRTTYGAPFYNLNELREGDEVITDTKWGTFRYEVTESEIVEPESLAIAIQRDRAEIVLTTCNPRFSAAQRLVVYARLVS
jgi:sortase A